MNWQVSVEAWAPAGGPGLNRDDGALDRLLDAVIPLAGAVASTERSWSVTVSIDEMDTPVAAGAQAVLFVTGAARVAGLPDWPILRLEVVEEEMAARELGVD